MFSMCNTCIVILHFLSCSVMNLKSQIHRISCFPYRHEGRSQEILLALCSFLLPSQKVSPFPLSHIRHYPLLQERSLDFARDDVAEVAFSQHTLYTERGLSIPHTVSLAASPQSPTTKKPQPKLELFCVRKTYLPNCASMVPAATAVPITPATFGPIACISR